MASPVNFLNMATPEVDVKNLPDGGMILKSPYQIEAYPDSQSQWIIDWAKKTPDTVFIADRTGPDGNWRCVTYRDFFISIRSIGQALLDRELSVENPVAILSDNGVDNALLLFAAMHVGIPVTPISPAYSLMSQDFGKLKHILGETKPGLVFADDGAKFGGALRAADFDGVEIVASRNPHADNVTEFEELLNTAPTDQVEQAFAKVGPDSIAKILFTSGSTGLPKGVINTQRMLCSNQQAISQVFKFLEDKPPVTVDWLPWNHTFGGNHNLNMMLRNGGSMYVDGGRPAPVIIEQTVANLKEISPTFYYNVPRGYDMLLPYLEADSELRNNFFRELDVIFYAAAALTQSAWEQLENLAIQETGKRVMMVAGWGSTETAPASTQVYWPIEKAGVMGLPIPGTELKLMPNDEKMEIRVRGPNVTPGYWKHDDLTAEAFDEDGFYCIGDAAKLEDPNDPTKGIVFDGRVSENFKLSSGTWVFVGGLRTNVVSAAPDAIQDAAITGHNKAELGILVFPNIAGCKALCPDATDETPLADIISRAEIRGALTDGIAEYNRSNPGSSTRIARALIMAEPPNIDANEITDKGYLNQRAVLTRRANLVDSLYSGGDEIIVFE